MESAMECYNFVAGEEDEDPRNVNIPESEGLCEVQGPTLEIPKITERSRLRRLILGQKQTLRLLPLETIGMMRL